MNEYGIRNKFDIGVRAFFAISTVARREKS